jgi:hypothetical protein
MSCAKRNVEIPKTVIQYKFFCADVREKCLLDIVKACNDTNYTIISESTHTLKELAFEENVYLYNVVYKFHIACGFPED